MFTLETELQGFPNRDDLKYKEIESFEPYKLLPCIAYAVAIGVPHIQNALIEFRNRCK